MGIIAENLFHMRDTQVILFEHSKSRALLKMSSLYLLWNTDSIATGQIFGHYFNVYHSQAAY